MPSALAELDIVVRGRLDDLDRDFAKAKGKAATAGEKVGKAAGEGIEEGVTREVSRAGGKIASTFESKLSKGLAAAGVAVGAAAGASLVVGLQNSMEREASQAKLGASLGLSDEGAARAGEMAGRIYANNFGESIDDVSRALQEVRNASLFEDEATDAQIEDLTAKVLTLADVFEVDLGHAVSTVGAAVREGLFKDGVEAVDALTVALQAVAPALRPDLLDALNEYSVFFAQLGIRGPEALQALVIASRGGIIAIDKTGDAIKEFTIRAVDGSKLTGDAFRDLGLDGEEMARMIAAGGDDARVALGKIVDAIIAIEDPVKQVQVGVALFGTPFEDLGRNAIPTLQSLKFGLEDTAGAAQRMVDQVGGTNAAKLETFKRSMEENVTKAAETAVGWLTKLPAPVQDFAATAAGLAPIVAPLTPLLAAMIPVLIGMGTAGGTAAFSLGALATGLWAVTAPVLLVIAVVGALVLAGWALVENWDWVKQKAGEAWSWTADHIGWAVGFIAGLFLGPLGWAIGAVVQNWDWVKETAGAAWDWITERIEGFIGFFTGMPGRIRAAASGMWDGIYDAFRSTLNTLISAWNRLGIPGFSVHIPMPGPIPDISFSWGGLSLPDIPLLDTGGIATGPTLAMLSGNRKPEAIIPLDRLGSMLEGSSRGGTTIIVQGSVIAERQLLDIARRGVDDVGRHNVSSGIKTRSTIGRG